MSEDFQNIRAGICDGLAALGVDSFVGTGDRWEEKVGGGFGLFGDPARAGQALGVITCQRLPRLTLPVSQRQKNGCHK